MKYRYFSGNDPVRLRTPILQVGGLTIALVILLSGAGSASAQDSLSPKVDEIRINLKMPLDKEKDDEELLLKENEKLLEKLLAERKTMLTEKIQGLKTLQEMSEALNLAEWETENSNNKELAKELAKIDLQARDKAAERFETAVATALQAKNPAYRQAVAEFVSDLADVNRKNAKRMSSRYFRESLAKLAEPLINASESDDPDVRLSIAAALAKIQPNPEDAVKALRKILVNGKDHRIDERRLAAQIIYRLYFPVPGETSEEEETVRTSLPRIVEYGSAVLPLAGVALEDPDSELQRIGATIFWQVATDWVTRMKTDEKRPNETVVARLRDAFHKQTKMLTEKAKESDPSAQANVVRTLETLCLIYRILDAQRDKPAKSAARPGAVSSTRDADQGRGKIDPSGSDLATIREALANCLTDTANDVDIRISAAQGLENLGDAAVPATTALVSALRDRDLFVRWSAARALGKIEASRRRAKVSQSAATKGAVYGLITLLSDTDLDVQIAAAVALEPYGGDAAKAAGPLANAAATGDPSFRLAAIHALGEIVESADTKTARTVATKLAGAVASPQDPLRVGAVPEPGDARVRAEAARLLGQLGPAAQDAIGALREALKDPEPSVRRAASEALLRIPTARPK